MLASMRSRWQPQHRPFQGPLKTTSLLKDKAALGAQVGIHSTLYKLPENIVEADVQTIVEQLSNDINVDGILVQLPLPSGLKEEIILQDISPVKDVDGGSACCTGR